MRNENGAKLRRPGMFNSNSAVKFEKINRGWQKQDQGIERTAREAPNFSDFELGRMTGFTAGDLEFC
jgi:hypothetical protein